MGGLAAARACRKGCFRRTWKWQHCAHTTTGGCCGWPLALLWSSVVQRPPSFQSHVMMANPRNSAGADGATLRTTRRCKAFTYHEVWGAIRGAPLVVSGARLGGRWSDGTLRFFFSPHCGGQRQVWAPFDAVPGNATLHHRGGFDTRPKWCVLVERCFATASDGPSSFVSEVLCFGSPATLACTISLEP